MGCIYRAICRANGKIYVGQTVHPDFKKRYKAYGRIIRHAHKTGRPISLFERALEKHGRENFDFRVLMANVSDKDRDALEIFFIKHFDSTNPAVGYNLESGGCRQKRLAESTKEKMRATGRAKRVRWKHADHGEVEDSAPGIVRRFPEQKLWLSALKRVRAGEAGLHKGWKLAA